FRSRFRKQLPDPAEVIEALPAAGEPGRELEVEGPELARLLEGLDRLAEEGEGLHKGRLRRAGPVVEGHGAVGLDVEDKIGGCHPGPLLKVAAGLEGGVGGVHLHQVEVLGMGRASGWKELRTRWDTEQD